MKNLILILFIGFAFSANAQSGRGSYVGELLDTTVTNAATPSVVLPVIGSKSAVSFQYVITKNSGTVGGTIVLQGSLDGGTTWAQLNSYSLTDATTSTTISYDYAAYPKYRVLITTTGTLSANIKIYGLYRE